MNDLLNQDCVLNLASFVGSSLFASDVGRRTDGHANRRYEIGGDRGRSVRSRSGTTPGLFAGGGNFITGGNGFSGGRGGDDGGGVGIVKDVQAGQQLSMPRRKRILMLMSDTGGGHRASAQALKAALDELYPDKVDVQIVDVFAELSGPFFRSIPEQYNFLMKHPTLWRVTYAGGQFWPTRQLAQRTYMFMNFNRLKEAFLSFEPDMIVSVHPLCQGPPLGVLNRLGIRDRVTFVTVVTDLGGANPTWFHSGVDRCYVPTQHLWDYAKRYKMKDHQLRQYGLPIRRMFWSDAPDSTLLRRRLGLKLNVPVVLVVGGGAGVGSLHKVAVTVARRIEQEEGPYGAQIVVVCGKNEKLREKLLFEEWPIPVKVTGFVSNMSEYMAAANCIITKAGPGTIAESLVRGLPIVLSGYLPGQEYGNVKFVQENGVGNYGKGAREIADLVCSLLGDPDEMAAMSKRAKDLGRPGASYDIAKNVGQLLFERRQETPLREMEESRTMAYSSANTSYRVTRPMLPV
ncbi:hypothetical protein NDN08_002422 [Rhodosorus marinus]|uniref:monogalactosyldiacylglycerol synthase n=1 Tax=Rhodosorus marinus TaxID=101924 RepID=A0AAV8UZG1_9RHOD|nr:hypothetical protein NDN08_002422 [Rhodosorus marinus]